jgi:MYXO-CTERM domain-containing protein
MSYRPLVLGIPLFVGLAGCALRAETGDELLASTDQPIMGGTDDAGDLNVVDIVWLQGQDISECSGSLLAPNMVLTAHHCVSTVQNEVNGGIDCAESSFAAPDVASNFFVSTKEFISMNASDYHTVRQVVVPPSSTNTSFCGVDQAILILSDNILPAEAVPLVPRVDTELVAKEVYTAIGFGGTVQDGTGAGTRRRLGDLHVDCVASGCSSIAGGEISLQHEWVGDHGTCEGDSGGPALDEYNRVVGVTSRGAADCTSPIYGDVYSWAAWIKATAQQAAQLGGYTAPPWVTGYPTDPAYGYPVGGTCSTPASCASNICLEDADGSYCSRLCEDAAPCPSGYTCETIDKLQICQRVPPPSTSSTGSGSSESPGSKSSCSLQTGDPTKPVPWLLGAAVAALALLRRRR